MNESLALLNITKQSVLVTQHEETENCNTAIIKSISQFKYLGTALVTARNHNRWN